ncbi:hypothetical protein CASFOL_011935 [Castilleja foliolosa]|uniref:Uncharacterized protein n=1 Tax=Castilleja foliolosa TaxID=1961234 RepID=A0ABD3DNY2_9LAMI
MMKLRSKRFSRSSSKLSGGTASTAAANSGGEIKWELRPGGMLVQKRETKQHSDEIIITIRVSAVSQWHHISLQSTSTFV